MSDNEINPEDGIPKNEETFSEKINEIKKEKKKFSILQVSTENVKLDIEGKANQIINNNNNLFTFKSCKNKINLKHVLNDVNNNLESLQNDLRKSLKTLGVQQLEVASNNRFKSSTKKEDTLGKFAIIKSKDSLNSQYLNDNDRKQSYIEMENTRLKQKNQKLEKELLDYKKYLNNMVQEKKMILQSINFNQLKQKISDSDNQNDNQFNNNIRSHYRDCKDLYYNSFKTPIYYCNQSGSIDVLSNKNHKLHNSDNNDKNRNFNINQAMNALLNN